MNDCVNAEMRDRLPDLLHERLDAGSRAAVMAHLDGCADCRAELALLRGVQEMLARTAPHVDVGRVVRAIPSRDAGRARWSSWRVAAAAAAIVAVGGASLTLMRSGGSDIVVDSSVASANQQAPVATPPAQPIQRSTTPSDSVRQPQRSSAQQVARGGDAAATELEMTGRLGELTDEELRLLIEEIDQLEAVPLPDPEPTVIPITSKATSGRAGT
jgi:hypothetical protein